MNQLTGPIPTEIGQMTGLIYLCVNGCAPRPARPSLRPRRALTLLLPASVLSIPRSPLTCSLRRYLNSNQLTGPIPIEIGQLTVLEDLYVHVRTAALSPACTPSSALAVRLPRSSHLHNLQSLGQQQVHRR